MIVIPPVTLPVSTTQPWVITAAMLTSSTVAEPSAGETAWVSGTTYAVGDVRIRTATHRKYMRQIAGAGTVAPETDIINWLDVGSTNKWAMFDAYRNVQTLGGTTLTVVIAPGKRINAIGIVGAEASQAVITMTIGATVYYTRTISLLLRHTLTATEYCFGSFRFNPNVLLLDLPVILGASITVTLTGSAVKCGCVILGQSIYMGQAQYGAANDGLNFSKITRDDFGNSSLVPRRTVKKTDQKLRIKRSQVDQMLQLREDANAVPMLWSGMDDKTDDGYFKALLILGIYKQFLIPVEFYDDTTMTLQLEEI